MLSWLCLILGKYLAADVKKGYSQVENELLLEAGSQAGFSEFQVTGMVQWGQNSKLKKIPRASKKPKNIPGPKINAQKNPMPNF